MWISVYGHTIVRSLCSDIGINDFVGVWRSGSALALGARGRRFDPCHPDQHRIPTRTQPSAGSLNLRFWITEDEWCRRVKVEVMNYAERNYDLLSFDGDVLNSTILLLNWFDHCLKRPLAQYVNEFEVLNRIEFFVQFILGDEVLLISLFQIIWPQRHQSRLCA